MLQATSNSLQTVTTERAQVEEDLREEKMRIETELRATLIQKGAEYAAEKDELQQKIKRFEENELVLLSDKEKLEKELRQKLTDVEKSLHDEKARLEVELREEKIKMDNATKEFKQREEALKREMVSKETELKQGMASMETQLKQDKASVESNLQAEVTRLKDLMEKNDKNSAQKISDIEAAKQMVFNEKEVCCF